MIACRGVWAVEEICDQRYKFGSRQHLGGVNITLGKVYAVRQEEGGGQALAL